jgi:hypothetical protein
MKEAASQTKVNAGYTKEKGLDGSKCEVPPIQRKFSLPIVNGQANGVAAKTNINKVGPGIHPGSENTVRIDALSVFRIGEFTCRHPICPYRNIFKHNKNKKKKEEK